MKCNKVDFIQGTHAEICDEIEKSLNDGSFSFYSWRYEKLLDDLIYYDLDETLSCSYDQEYDQWYITKIDKAVLADLRQELSCLLLDVQDAIHYLDDEDVDCTETYCNIISDRGHNIKEYLKDAFIQ